MTTKFKIGDYLWHVDKHSISKHAITDIDEEGKQFCCKIDNLSYNLEGINCIGPVNVVDGFHVIDVHGWFSTEELANKKFIELQDKKPYKEKRGNCMKCCHFNLWTYQCSLECKQPCGESFKSIKEATHDR